ncbi:MAG: DUF2254 domain-containing protein [Chthoniobacter sp.]|nr:DUF2254 domain-containing protein [Chthoniobacter sp.]
MTWNRHYRVASYFRSSLWVIPIGAIVLEQVFAAIVQFLDARIGWAGAGFGVEGARAVANAVITLTLSFVVFTFGSLLVAIQVASGQYTPRIIATTLLRDNVIRYTVGLFVFALLFAIKALNHTETEVPQLLTFITGILGLLCLAAFLFLIDYAARLLRPVSLVKRVGEEGLAVIESVYPESFNAAQGGATSIQDSGSVERTIVHHGTSAIVLAVDIKQLLNEAGKANGVIEFAPQVGDFAGSDEPLFLLHGNATAVDEHTLRACIIFGSERTMEQDPLFAFRILVDIAIKALSAAINDPTTAVLAIDQLHRLLRNAGRRNLRTANIFDRQGALRVIFRTPDWDDFIHLAFAEIRFYGASNIQIARRLRAMIINLANTLPAERHPALRQELDLLDRMLEKLYLMPEDLALARIPDSQGLGGSTETGATRWAA